MNHHSEITINEVLGDATEKSAAQSPGTSKLGARGVRDSEIWRTSRKPCHAGRHLKGCLAVVYGYMANLGIRDTGRRGFCFPRPKLIAKRLGYSLSEVYLAIEILEHLGAITAAECSGKSGWFVRDHADWTHTEGSQCCVSHRDRLALIGKKRASNRKNVRPQSENPIPISTFHAIENTDFPCSVSSPTLLQVSSVISEEPKSASQNHFVGTLTEDADKPSVKDLFEEAIENNQIEETLGIISFDLLEIENAAFAKYSHMDDLRTCCVQAIRELGARKFQGRATCVAIMDRVMSSLRGDFGWNAPRPWVPILRRLRQEVTIETCDEVDAFVERHARNHRQWAEAEPLPEVSESELAERRSRPLRADAIWCSFQARALAQLGYQEIMDVFKQLEELGRADSLERLAPWLERAIEISRSSPLASEFFEAISWEVKSKPGGVANAAIAAKP